MNAASHPVETTPTDLAGTEHIPRILGMLGDKWTILVIQALSEGPKRFNALRRDIPAVSQKMLTTTLRNLERNGLVLRQVTPTSPPQVDYSLTVMGEDLKGSVCSVAHWAVTHAEALSAAQAHHDAQHPPK